ncbi:MAG: 4Fe-4S binding protein, partial [Clostridiales bacterium]|nr:4Fe-4S binding protein [Clostridiales bacterium]
HYKKRYKTLIERDEDASLCIECGECEEACPQHIEIIEMLQEAHALLT